MSTLIGVGPRLEIIGLLLLLAPLVLVPMGLPLVRVEPAAAARVLGWAKVVQPVGALAAVVSFLLPVGPLAGAIALVWLLVGGLSTVAALVMVIARRSLVPAVLVPAASLTYLAVGAGWVVISRFGLRPQQLPSDIVELTGVHFHYAGFVTLTIASLVMAETNGKLVAHRLATAGGIAAVVGTPLIAVGFVILPIMLVVGAVVLVTGVTTIAAITLVSVVPSARPMVAKICLGISAVAVLLPMALALSYAMGRVFGLPSLGVQAMAATHGILNAVGFGSCGLIGWYAMTIREVDDG